MLEVKVGGGDKVICLKVDATGMAWLSVILISSISESDLDISLVCALSSLTGVKIRSITSSRLG